MDHVKRGSNDPDAKTILPPFVHTIPVITRKSDGKLLWRLV